MIHQSSSNRVSEPSDLDRTNNRNLAGLFVCYQDDKLNECVNSTLRKKSRVRYKSMDVFSNFIAFGTTGGTVYLFRLKTLTHSSCQLVSVIPCDQGSIDVVKFLPNRLMDDLLIAIGTSRGSLVIFRLTSSILSENYDRQFNSDKTGDIQPSSLECNEVYRANTFTSMSGIKMIEYDQDLIDPMNPFNKLYICDTSNRLYVLDTDTFDSTAFGTANALKLFYNNNAAHNLPALIFSVNDSNINQISVHKSQLLISTDETTRFFNEHNNQLQIIGKKKRREGFFGACFFNPNFKPIRVLQLQQQQQQAQYYDSQQSLYSSTNSLSDLENLLILVARPMFRMWQVNHKREVMFTHQFDTTIRTTQPSQPIALHNEPTESAPATGRASDDIKIMRRAFGVDEDEETEDADDSAEANGGGSCSGDENELERTITTAPADRYQPPANGTPDGANGHKVATSQRYIVKSNHFERLLQTHSETLGNLIVSYTEHELFVVDPMEVRLIAWYSQEESIVHVCCNENEIYLWSAVAASTSHPNASSASSKSPGLRLTRLVLLAPTQFVLELHRIQWYMSLVMFMEIFHEQFRKMMALPLSSSSSLITHEGGLLRNILVNAWSFIFGSGPAGDNHENAVQAVDNQSNGGTLKIERLKLKQTVDEIMSESKQLKESMKDLSDSRFFLQMTNENLERLCREPYPSLVSLDVTLKNLHTNRVIYLNKNSINRQKSMENLAQDIKKLKRAAYSIGDVSQSVNQVISGETNSATSNAIEIDTHQPPDKNVIVERQIPSNTRKIRPETFRILGHQTDYQESDDDDYSRHTNGRDDRVDRSGDAAECDTETDRYEDQLEAANCFSQEKRTSSSRIKLSDDSLSMLKVEVVDFTRCNNCQWPKSFSHLKPLHSSQQIQFNWLRDNLLDKFETNLDQIEEHSFKHGLWHLWLKCLLAKRKYQDFVTCCIMLNDVRLLDSEEFLGGQPTDVMIDLVLGLMEKAAVDQPADSDQSAGDAEKSNSGNHEGKYLQEVIEAKSSQRNETSCFKCGTRPIEPRNDEQNIEGEESEEEDWQEQDEIRFSVTNLFEGFILKHNDILSIRVAVDCMLRHPKLLQKSQLAASFYLRVISGAIQSASSSGYSLGN